MACIDSTPTRVVLPLVFIVWTAAPEALASDWVTGGGGSSRSHHSGEVGPTQPDIAWTAASNAWSGSPVFVEGNRAFRVGVHPTAGFPSSAECFDLGTGTQLWAVPVPSGPTAGGYGRCLGVDHGRVYVTRGERIVALATSDGSTLWTSALAFVAEGAPGPHMRFQMDLAFDPLGEVYVDGMESVFRLRASDGTMAWEAPRPQGTIGGYGCAALATAVYAVANTYPAAGVPASAEILRINPITGAIAYGSGSLGALPSNCPPFLGADGAVHVALTESLASTPPPQLVTLRDTGSGFALTWSVPTSVRTAARHATCSDGSVLHVSAASTTQYQLQRLAAATGAVLATSGTIVGQLPPDTSTIAVDALDRVFVSNRTPTLGGPPDVPIGGHLTALEADLSLRWMLDLPTFSLAAPALATSGTLLIARAGSVLAIRSPHASTQSFCDSPASPCPCLVGYPGHGCPNSERPSGARLASDGVASLGNDTLRLHIVGLTEGPCMFLQGNASSGAGLRFGDGVLCLGGTATRLGVEYPLQSRAVHPASGGTPISVSGQIPLAGPTTRYYQGWYRDSAPFCGPSTFNLTNALEVLWP